MTTTAQGVEVRATVARLLSEIARPRPMVAILEGLKGYQLAEAENPHTGQRVYAMSRSLYERLDRDLLVRRAKSIRDYAEVSYHSGRSLPDDMPEPHTLRLEPTPIEES